MCQLHRPEVDFDTLLDAIDENGRYVAGRSRNGRAGPKEGGILLMPGLEGGTGRWLIDFLNFCDPVQSPSFVGAWFACCVPAPAVALRLVA